MSEDTAKFMVETITHRAAGGRPAVYVSVDDVVAYLLASAEATHGTVTAEVATALAAQMSQIGRRA